MPQQQCWPSLDRISCADALSVRLNTGLTERLGSASLPPLSPSRQTLTINLRRSALGGKRLFSPALQTLLPEMELTRLFLGHPETVVRRCHNGEVETVCVGVPAYRQQMVELVRTGRTAEELSQELECSPQSDPQLATLGGP